MNALNLVYRVGNCFDGFIHVADADSGHLDGCLGFIADVVNFFGDVLDRNFKLLTGSSHALDGAGLRHYLFNHFFYAGVIANVFHGFIHTHNVIVVGFFEDGHHFVEFFYYLSIGINGSIKVGIFAVDELLHGF